MHYEVALISEDFDMVPILLYPYNMEHVFDPVEDEQWIGMMEYRRQYFARYGLCSEYSRNPQDFIERYKNLPDYVKYVQEGFPKVMKMGDEELLHYPQIYRSEWDGFELGGHYNNHLLLKSGQRSNSARICDIDWERMQKAGEHCLPPFEQCDEICHQLYHDEEDYIKTESGYNTWIVLDELGWHNPEPEMNFTDEIAASWKRNWFDRFIRPCNPESIFTVVDIHC
jgi:hypothetical protein